MKKFIPRAAASFFLAFLICSCSNPQDTQGVDARHDNTLRSEFQGRFEGIEWTEELELGLIADRKVLDSARFSSRGLATVASASVVAVPDSQEIYPSIPGFGSIDIRRIPASLKSAVEGFCGGLLDMGGAARRDETYSSLASRILPGRQYMLSVYLHDTAAYPPAARFFLGSPSVRDGRYEVPVLFLSSQGSWIVSLYALRQEGEWKIEQIRYGDFVYE